MTSTITLPTSSPAGYDDRAEIVAMRGITKTYSNGVIEVEALRGIDLTIRDGEYVAIIGPSGSGKSTLMNIIGCLDVPTDGEYLLDGQDVATLRENQLADIRNRRIGFVFQQYNLLASLNAWRNVELPLGYAGVAGGRRKQRALAALELVGLGDRAEHRPGELSGGQQQRVAVARALVTDPALILADEPTGNLDSTSTGDMLDLLADLHGQGRTIVLITHDAEVASSADRIVHVRDGLIVSDEVNDSVRAPHSAATTRAEAVAMPRSAVLTAAWPLAASAGAFGPAVTSAVEPSEAAPVTPPDPVASASGGGEAPATPRVAEVAELGPASPVVAPEAPPRDEATEPIPAWFPDGASVLSAASSSAHDIPGPDAAPGAIEAVVADTAEASGFDLPDVPWWRRRSADAEGPDGGVVPGAIEDLLPTVVNLAAVPSAAIPPVAPRDPVRPLADVLVTTPSVASAARPSWADGLPPARFVSGPDWPHPSRLTAREV